MVIGNYMMVGIQCNLMLGGRLLMLNNSVTFSGKPMGSEEFLNQMAEALGEIKLLNYRKNKTPFIHLLKNTTGN